MPQLSGVWDDVVASGGLQRLSMSEVVGQSWQFADAVLGYGGGRNTLLSTIKIRNFGFAECIDTARMFREQFALMQDNRILPV